MTDLLFEAAGVGDCEKIRQRLAEGDDVDYVDKIRGRTSLIETVANGYKDAAELLLDSGADVDAICPDSGKTSVMCAAEIGFLDILRMLIDRGADINLAPEEEYFGRNAAMLAAGSGRINALKILVESGADLSFCDRRGHNVMQESIERGRHECCQYLESIGAPGPKEPPVGETLEWPELSWDPTTMSTDFVLPDGVSPEEVVRSYILTMNHWETKGDSELMPEQSFLKEDGDWDYEARAVYTEQFRKCLARGAALAKIHLTDKKRTNTRCSVGSPPQFSAGYSLMGVTKVKPSRVEIHIRHLSPENDNERYEWIFVCLKKNGQWRIDSGKSRMVGTLKYERDYLA
ncbi:ankyrin repeat domain-containing protein [Corynebacterium mustelae]|nr:ankyrin repeat domain-containing protein [Corynebacterium mustelae]